MIKTFKKSCRRTFSTRGLSLIEVAIVLAVASIILATLWTAASSFYFQRDIGLASDELNQIAANIHALYEGQSTSGLAAANYSSFTNEMLNAGGVFPLDMVNPTTGTLSNPWNRQNTSSNTVKTALLASTSAPDGSPLTQFAIEFLSVPRKYCSEMLVKNSQPGVDTTNQLTLPGSNGLSAVCAGTSCFTAIGGLNGLLPITPAVATGVCKSTTLSLVWYFNLGN